MVSSLFRSKNGRWSILKINRDYSGDIHTFVPFLNYGIIIKGSFVLRSQTSSHMLEHLSFCILQVFTQLNYVLNYFSSKCTEAFLGVTANQIWPFTVHSSRWLTHQLVVHPSSEFPSHIIFHSLRLLDWDLLSEIYRNMLMFCTGG